jgi:hypothetical protein
MLFDLSCSRRYCLPCVKHAATITTNTHTFIQFDSAERTATGRSLTKVDGTAVALESTSAAPPIAITITAAAECARAAERERSDASALAAGRGAVEAAAAAGGTPAAAVAGHLGGAAEMTRAAAEALPPALQPVLLLPSRWRL